MAKPNPENEAYIATAIELLIDALAKQARLPYLEILARALLAFTESERRTTKHPSTHVTQHEAQVRGALAFFQIIRTGKLPPIRKPN